ncbi:hypothetical protein DFR68_103199 [Nocardia mexicana]|uniref:Uncharacterized protein n=1 Tax=Nocardia mexicana TaxID=279262 RepID=A0A370HD76_9NOCA|nr:hypothetical protein DFR68_103199 [Nocardia mexicana]
MNGGPVAWRKPELFARWAIVTTGGGCGSHDGPCPNGVWGPYHSLADAESAAKFVTAVHNPHVVPYWSRGNGVEAGPL